MRVTSRGELSDIDIIRQALEPDYEIIEELGRGGMAIVLRARERELDRDVAVKVLPFTLAFDADLVERFQREAKTAAQLEHPHIIPVYRVGRKGEVIYFAMKLLRGESLSSLLERRGMLTAAEVRRILAEAGSALGYAARRGVVHRDVKPDNIMLDEDERCVVTDFGIARSRSESKLTATGMTLGTPRYMSPEQARARDVDGRSDLYSLGCVAYECLVGRPPFDAEDAVAILMDHINAPLPRPSLRTDEERALFDVIERMLAKDPGDRFQSADELLAALGVTSGMTGQRPAFGAAGRRPLTPTRPSTAVDDTVSAAPQAAGASRTVLARNGLQAGARLLRAGGVRLASGVARGRELANAHRPGLEAALIRARDGALLVHAGARRHGWRTWAAIVTGVAVLTGAYWGTHFATAHRSRCPVPAAVEQATSESDGAGPGSLSLLLDPVSNRPRNSALDVYYDICGLDEGTPVRSNIVVSRSASGLKRLLGAGTPPVTANFEDEASGPATRRHRRIDLDGLPPGSYRLEVSVVDNRGRRRAREVGFEIRE